MSKKTKLGQGLLNGLKDALSSNVEVSAEEIALVEAQEGTTKINSEPKTALDLFKGGDNQYYKVELQYDADTMEATVVSVTKLDNTFQRAAFKFNKEMYLKIKKEKYRK